MAIIAGRRRSALAFLLAVGLGLWLGRLPRLCRCRSAAAALSFAAAAAALAWATPRMAAKPLLAAVVLAGVTTVDLAYNNGPTLLHRPAAGACTTCCSPTPATPPSPS